MPRENRVVPDPDEQETCIGLAVNKNDLAHLAGWLARDIDPDTGRKIASEGRRLELISQRDYLQDEVDGAEEFLAKRPPTGTPAIARPVRVSQMNQKLASYLEERHASDLADGWELDMIGDRVLLCRGSAVRQVDLPAHLRPVADAGQWHREHTARAPTGLPLFAERDRPQDQGRIF